MLLIIHDFFLQKMDLIKMRPFTLTQTMDNDIYLLGIRSTTT